jgi:hypothetical protein
MLKTVLAACALLCALSTATEARRLDRATGLHPMCNVTMPCELPYASSALEVRETRGKFIARDLGFGGPAIVAHPAGCPSRAFCGCGAAVRVFGRPVRELWLAANWFKFPRASPAAGMVAVRRHHVFVLEQALGGDSWLAYDANSGRHATRIHARSIAGYTIVNPHGSG